MRRAWSGAVADWSVIEPALSGWVTARTGLPAHYGKRPRAHQFSDDGWVRLYILGRSTVGNDMIRREYDATQPASQEIRTYQDGARQFTLQCQVRCQRAGVDHDAKHYTSLLRDSVDLPNDSTAVFAAADIAFAAVASEVELDELQDGRARSIAQIDLRFNAISKTEGTGDAYITTIKDADLELPEGTVRSTNDYTVG